MGLLDSDEKELIASVIAQRDFQAYGKLVKLHQAQLRNFLRRLTRNDALSDDLAQDTFLHAWNKIDSYTGRGSFTSWLLKIAYNNFLQSKRKSSRYEDILHKVEGDMNVAVLVHTDVQDELSDLDRYLSVLTEEERSIMVLCYACGLSHSEISETMELPLGTVKSMIFRGKRKIRKSFQLE